MDPFSITAGALQIAGACAQCTITIIKWVGDVRSVDNRISSFCDEVAALKATYEGLEKSLSSPMMAEAARIANQTADGAPLWIQIKEALDDSRRTMNRVNEVLTEIGRHTGVGRRVKTQLSESLNSGELSRLRQRIQFFNSALSLPIQMVCVWLQLEQKNMSRDHQLALDRKLSALEQSMTQLISQFANPGPARSQTLDSSTTIVASDTMSLSDSSNMKTYIAFAKKFLQTASAAASVRSSLSTVSPPIDSDFPDIRPPSLPDNPLPNERRARLVGWIPQPPTEANGAGDSGRQTPVPQTRRTQAAEDDDTEVEFMRTKRHLKLGQERVEAENHSGAEIHFRKALALMEKHDFGVKISLQPAEVVVMLAECCLQQQKLDQAIELLRPVAERSVHVFPTDEKSPILQTEKVQHESRPDQFQALAASHMLGQAFLQKQDFDSAEEHSLKAFSERRKLLGPQDEKTLQSVQLVISVYKEQGDEEEAEGYEVFLQPPEPPKSASPSRSSVEFVQDSIPPTPVLPSPPILPQPQPQAMKRNSKSGLTSRLRNFGRGSQEKGAASSPTSDWHRLSMSRSTTQNDTSPDVDPRLRPEVLRSFSSPSETSTHERSMSLRDDESISTSMGILERSSSSRTIEPIYLAIAELCKEGKVDRATKVALAFLDSYKSNVMVIRRAEIEKNIKKGSGMGLARTGKGYSPLHFFCDLKEEHAEEVAMLLKQGVDVNAIAYQAGYTASNPKGGFTALQQAVERGHSTITSLLLQVPGIVTTFLNSDDMTPIMIACRKGFYDIVKQLLAFPPPSPTDFPTTWNGNSLLHDAARFCDPTLVEMLLEHTVDVDLKDRFGKTPLMHAIIKADIHDSVQRSRRVKGRAKTVQLLLEAGADPTLKDHRTEVSIREYAEKEADADLMMMLDQTPRKGVVELLA